MLIILLKDERVRKRSGILLSIAASTFTDKCFLLAGSMGS